jgi:hypothetical protein
MSLFSSPGSGILAKARVRAMLVEITLESLEFVLQVGCCPEQCWSRNSRRIVPFCGDPRYVAFEPARRIRL